MLLACSMQLAGAGTLQQISWAASQLSTKTLYQILEVAQSASIDEIKSAYRRQAMKWHPDRNPSSVAEAERRFKEIGYAYKVLSDPEARMAYDAELDSEQAEASESRGSRRSQSSESSREDADTTFFDEMLDLAFELSRRGYPLDKILKMLMALDCPESVARAVAKRLDELGASARATNNGRGKSAPSGSSTKSTNNDERVPRDITQVEWEAAAPYYEAYLGKSCGRFLDSFACYHSGNPPGLWKRYSFFRFFAGGYWFAYRKMVLPTAAFAVFFILSMLVTDPTDLSSLSALLGTGIGIGICSIVAIDGPRILYKAATRSINEFRGTATSVALPRISEVGKPSHIAWVGLALIVASSSFVIAYQYEKKAERRQATMNVKVDVAIARIERLSPELANTSPDFNEAAVNYILDIQRRLIDQGIDPDVALLQAYQQYLLAKR